MLNYDQSLLSIVSSILTHYGAPTNHKTLPILDKMLKKSYKNIVLMLFDGMGTAILQKHLPEDSFFRKNINSTISSVFPPTTTAATVSIESGLSPIEHGWLGWNLYFDEIGANVSIFPNTLSGSNGIPAATYNVARRLLPYKDIFTKISDATHGEVKAVSVSPFSSYESHSVDEICASVKELCAESGRHYIYTYWHQPDYDMHEFGTTDKRITAHIKKFNDDVEALCADLDNTLVLVTADHGLVDTTWLFLPNYPSITQCLECMPSIESRALSFFVKSDMKAQFEHEFTKYFGDCYSLITKDDAIQLFGDGIPHPRSYGFIGDYIAIATGSVSIDCQPYEKSKGFKAVHAGMTDDEINVPLICFECLK